MCGSWLRRSYYRPSLRGSPINNRGDEPGITEMTLPTPVTVNPPLPSFLRSVRRSWPGKLASSRLTGMVSSPSFSIEGEGYPRVTWPRSSEVEDAFSRISLAGECIASDSFSNFKSRWHDGGVNRKRAVKTEKCRV